MIANIHKLISGSRYMASRMIEHQSMYGSEPQEDAAITETLKAASELEKQITEPAKQLNADHFSERICRCTKEC